MKTNNNRIRTRKEMSHNNNNNENDDDVPPPPPSYYGNSMMTATNISFSPMNDHGEEITRRVQQHPSPVSLSTSPSSSTNITTVRASPMKSVGTINNNNNKKKSSKALSKTATTATKRYQKSHQKMKSSSMAKRMTLSTSDHWNLQQHTIPTKPEFHPLELTATFVPNVFNNNNVSSANIMLSSLINSIRVVLQSRGIKSSYYCTPPPSSTYEISKAAASPPPKIKCVTKDNVDFRIYFYKGRNKYNHGVIVEIQRRYGQSFNFRHDVSCILNAAESVASNNGTGTTKHQQQLQQKEDEQSDQRCLSLLNVVSDDEEEDDDADDGGSMSDTVCNLLKSRHPDTRLLGLQLLSSLVNSKKIGTTRTSQSILHEMQQTDDSLMALLREMSSTPVVAAAKDEEMDLCQEMSTNILSTIYAS
jgi:hypothetical protein